MTNKKKSRSRNRNKSKKQTKTFKIIKEPDFPPIPSLFGGDLVLEGAYNLTKLTIKTFDNPCIQQVARKLKPKGKIVTDLFIIVDLKKRIEDAQEYLFEFKEKFSDGNYMTGMKNFKEFYNELSDMEDHVCKSWDRKCLPIIACDETAMTEVIQNIGIVFMAINNMGFGFDIKTAECHYTGDEIQFFGECMSPE